MRRVLSELHVTNRPSETAMIDRIEPSWPIVVFSKLSSEDFKGFSHFPSLAKFDSLRKDSLLQFLSGDPGVALESVSRRRLRSTVLSLFVAAARRGWSMKLNRSLMSPAKPFSLSRASGKE